MLTYLKRRAVKAAGSPGGCVRGTACMSLKRP